MSSELSSSTHFGESDLVAPEWRLFNRDRRDWGDSREISVKQHKQLFNLILQEPLKPATIDEGQWELKSTSPDFYELLDVCSLAEYYGCLSPAAAAVVTLLGENEHLWRNVAHDPLLYFRLSVKLQWKELYFDAMRHIIVSPQGYTHLYDPPIRHSLADHLGISLFDLEQRLKQDLDDQVRTIDRLETDLRRLQYTPSFDNQNLGASPVHLAFFDPTVPVRDNNTKAVRLMASGLLTGAIFGH